MTTMMTRVIHMAHTMHMIQMVHVVYMITILAYLLERTENRMLISIAGISLTESSKMQKTGDRCVRNNSVALVKKSKTHS